MTINAGLFSSRCSEWMTPMSLYKKLDAEFHFKTDPCTTSDNPLRTEYFYTKEDNGLTKVWHAPVFINPPYGRKISDWVKRASMEAMTGNAPIVMLLPARTDTRWFHEYILGKAEIRFLEGRITFEEAMNSAPFPSMVVVFGKREAQESLLRRYYWK